MYADIRGKESLGIGRLDITGARNVLIEKEAKCKKSFLANKFIEKIEIYPNEKEDGSLIKSITFRFPLSGNENRLDFSSGDGQTTGNQVETVVLMDRG